MTLVSDDSDSTVQLKTKTTTTKLRHATVAHCSFDDVQVLDATTELFHISLVEWSITALKR